VGFIFQERDLPEMNLYGFLWRGSSDDIQDISSSVARQRFNTGEIERVASYFALLALEFCEVGCSFFVADDDDTVIAVVENFSEVHDILSIKGEVEACQALTVGLTVPLAVLTDAVLAFVVNEDEVACTHFLVRFGCL
jgi:hypothetical protein